MRSARRNSHGALPTGSASSRLHSARSTRRSQASLSMTGATSRSKTTPRLESERKTAQPAQPSIALSLTEVRGSELWPESLPSLQSAVSLTVRSEIAQRGGDINNDAIVHQMRLGVDNHAASRLALAAQKRASNKASYDHAHAAVKQAKPTTTLRNSLKYTPTSRDKKASVPQYGSADQYYQALQDALLREDSDSTTDSDDDRFDVNAAVQKLTGSASSYVSPVDMWPVRAFPSGSSETMPSIDIDELRATFSKRGSATPSAASARSARGARGFSRPGLPRPKSAAALLGAKRPPAVHTAFAEGSAATGPFTPTAGAIGRPARQADRRTGDTVLQSPLGSSIRADPRDVVTPSAGAGGGAKGKGKTGSTSKSKGKGKGKGKDKGDEDVVIPELTSLMKKPPSFTVRQCKRALECMGGHVEIMQCKCLTGPETVLHASPLYPPLLVSSPCLPSATSPFPLCIILFSSRVRRRLECRTWSLNFHQRVSEIECRPVCSSLMRRSTIHFLWFMRTRRRLRRLIRRRSRLPVHGL